MALCIRFLLWACGFSWVSHIVQFLGLADDRIA